MNDDDEPCYVLSRIFNVLAHERTSPEGRHATLPRDIGQSEKYCLRLKPLSK